MKSILAGSVAVGLVCVIAANAQAEPVLSAGFDPSATLSKSVRFRSFNNSGSAEVVVNGGGGTAQTDVTWNFPRGITVTYDDASGNLTAGVTGPVVSAFKNVGTLTPLNYLQIEIVKQGSTNSVSLNNIMLNGVALGSLSVPSASTTQWKITGLDLQDGFTLTGTIAVNGLSGGGDSNFIEVKMGFVVPSDGDGPITSNVDVEPKPVILNGNATVTANVDDSTTGGSTIASAHYQLDGGTLVSMSAADGAFDEVSEEVEASFLATAVGTRDVCVHGTDEHNNDGDQTCQTFLVTYQFDGFFSPIETDLVNIAKAGQAVPVKWRLTDANDVPIDDPGSFVNVFSYPVSCGTFSGEITDAVDEYAAGASGLQWIGDGYWQFNWKTPKDYANTCRAMYVEFNSGALSPIVKFHFKR